MPFFPAEYVLDYASPLRLSALDLPGFTPDTHDKRVGVFSGLLHIAFILGLNFRFRRESRLNQWPSFPFSDVTSFPQNFAYVNLKYAIHFRVTGTSPEDHQQRNFPPGIYYLGAEKNPL